MAAPPAPVCLLLPHVRGCVCVYALVSCHPRWCAVATGYGGWGAAVRSVADLAPALERARAVATSAPGTSALLNAFIGSTNFREGSLSV